MTKLEKLDLSHSPITDVGLPGLQKLAGLKELNLERTMVSDAGVAHFRFLRFLEKLDLYRTGITDKALLMLLAVPTLKELSLDRTKITDAGLVHLGKLRSHRRCRSFVAFFHSRSS